MDREVKTKILVINSETPESHKIGEAADILKNGGLVAFPTETVYGLAALHDNDAAINKLYEVKNRPMDKPFTVHISREEMIDMFDCEVSVLARKLMKRFWPGPLTIILKKKNGEGTLGFRMPDNKIAFGLIKKAGVPVVAPSANISGNKPPTSAAEVLRDLDGKVEIVIDGGKTAIGIESTVVDMTGRRPKVLREGAIPKAEIERI